MKNNKLVVILDNRDFSIPPLQRALQKDGFQVKVIPWGRKSPGHYRLEQIISDASNSLNIGREFLAKSKVKSLATPKIVSVSSEKWEFVISEVYNRTGYGFIPDFNSDDRRLS
jgi:hypothetical protein